MARVPRYQVIYEDLSSQISSGALGPDAQLPSETALAQRYGVSRMTVRQAVRQLQEEHRLTRRRGAGTFVTRPSGPRRRLNRLRSFADEIDATPSRVRNVVLRREVVTPPDDVVGELDLGEQQDVVLLERVRWVDDEPAAVQESWVPYAVAPMLAREDLAGDSLYRTLQERYGLRLGWAEQEVAASAATAAQAESLAVPEGSPLIATRRRTFDDTASPVEFARSWMRPEFPVVLRLEA
jgi:GntR family transcriptional regulator